MLTNPYYQTNRNIRYPEVGGASAREVASNKNLINKNTPCSHALWSRLQEFTSIKINDSLKKHIKVKLYFNQIGEAYKYDNSFPIIINKKNAIINRDGNKRT